ncbi:aldose 1-epimerase [Paenibacillus sp. VTT E-133280]|jgi:aldose 1-epimerase|uniref:aldose 1-epimerase n=1 Tax=Paenibacillus TaxID=44249 RepID=UPI000BA14ED3|nr:MULTISPECIES: aldose 1-epimerase [unclassified Paenibacillus]MDH6372342.1 aldose 1-epimerase [Paenibacillus sp. PastF-3]OZQ61971.1 aldose 1-epimerase [Paenibacillus sp. VTT E-133280]OZQ85279.1 aldose 1-epimerase [Paenibacillus sp. VTT E-133291]
MKQVTKGQWGGYDTYILHSRELEVTLLPRLGNNVISLFDVKKQREILRRPDESDQAFFMQKPYHFGMPLLIPPGRIRKGQFQFEGTSYQFDQNTANDNHIHGLHRTQAWCVSDIEEDEDGCAVTTEFLTEDDPHWMEQFPIPLKFEMTFRLQEARFTQTLKVTNLGDHRIPFGIGYHTWFMIDGEPERWNLKLPVNSIYELNDELLPSGNLIPLGDLEALNTGMNMQGTNFDTALRIGEKQPVEALLLRDDGYGLRYTADENLFRHWVLYTKGPAEQFLCIEPYTWLANAPNVSEDASFTGLLTIEPGQSQNLSTVLEMIYPEI